LTSVWIFAGAVTCRRGWRSCWTVLIFGHLWERIWRRLRAGRRIG